MQTARRFKFEKNAARSINYLLFLPQNYNEKSGKRYPLIFFLHGAGERGSNVWNVATHGPPKIVSEQPDFPFIVLSPQCPDGEHWSNDSLLALLDDTIRKFAVDEKRIYLTGMSMGGYGAWDLGLNYPERFAALAPVCGGGQMITLALSAREKPQVLISLPVWAFHGAKDPVVPLDESQRMVDALKKAGAKEVKFTVYPDLGHNSWTKTYSDPELYKWFLSHSTKGTR